MYGWMYACAASCIVVVVVSKIKRLVVRTRLDVREKNIYIYIQMSMLEGVCATTRKQE